MTSILVTALCNQPEAFALNLGDDQLRYLHNQCMSQFRLSLFMCGFGTCAVIFIIIIIYFISISKTSDNNKAAEQPIDMRICIF